MTAAPGVVHVTWARAHRIIATRHPPIDLFEDIADPSDWDAIISGENKTNTRIVQSVGLLDRVPRARRVGGPGASFVMAPFTHASPASTGRFHDGTFGAYYAARSFETALAETMHHSAKFYLSTAEAPGWFSQFRELVGSIDNEFHELRDRTVFAPYLDPVDYLPSQALARTLRADGSNGIVYPSVRDAAGECVAAFWPDAIGKPRAKRALAYHFDGRRIDYVREEPDGAVFKVEP